MEKAESREEALTTYTKQALNNRANVNMSCRKKIV